MSTLKANRYENTASSDGGINIDSAGKVGVNQSSPSQMLHVEDSGSNVYVRVTETGNTGIDFGQATNGNGVINLRDNADIQILTNGVEELRVLAAGGLTFNGDTAAANALGDYEEGTFSPTYVSGLTSDTYSNTGGHYTKIGNFVTFTIRIAGAGTNSGSEQVQIGNLPFTASSSAREGGAWFNYRHDLDTGGAPFMHITQGGDDILWYGSGGSSWVGSDGAGLNNKTFHIQGFYYTDS